VATSSRGGQPADGGLCVLFLRCDSVGAGYGRKSELVFGTVWWMLNSVLAVCGVGVLDARSKGEGHSCMYICMEVFFFERFCNQCSHT